MREEIFQRRAQFSLITWIELSSHRRLSVDTSRVLLCRGSKDENGQGDCTGERLSLKHDGTFWMFQVQEPQICLIRNYLSLNRKANSVKESIGNELSGNKKGVPKNAPWRK
jgi:hypothetical protein